MAMTYTFTEQDSKFDVPADRYERAKLVEIKELPPSPQNPEWGPSLAFEFVIESGEQAGKQVSALCSQKMSTMSNLWKLIQSMSRNAHKPGDAIDLTQFVGKVYEIDVEMNKAGTRTRVMKAVPARGTAAQAPAPARQGPPPRKPAPGQPAAPAKSSRFYVGTDDGEILMNLAEVAAFLNDKDPAAVPCVAEGEDEWKTCKDYGLTSEIPF